MAKPLLIEATVYSNQNCHNADELGRINAAFYIPQFQGLNIEATGWSSDAKNFLLHAIARSPDNLRYHVQRIFLLITKKDEEHLYSALLDLFIILADKGYHLRKRMLEAAQPILRNNWFMLLQQHLEGGLTTPPPLAPCKNSILSKGLSGQHPLIEQDEKEKRREQDPLDIAHDHIEYGQIDAAREVLEKAIADTPNREEYHLELLEIYCRTKDAERYHTKRMELEKNNSPHLRVWHAQADSF